MWKKRSSILVHATKNLVKRTISKQQGNLNIGEQMPVQALIQDLLQNGLDLTSINGDSYKKMSYSFSDFQKRSAINKKKEQ